MFKEVKELIDGELYVIPGKQPMPAESVRLRLLVTADSWDAQYCPQGGTEFHTAATGELPPPGDDQVSIQCYNGPADEQHWIRFEKLLHQAIVVGSARETHTMQALPIATIEDLGQVPS